VKVRRIRAGDLLQLERRARELMPHATYTQVGVRSFGKGLFIKEPTTGLELGNKHVYDIHVGDLVISNIFAWEGAIGVARPEHHGLIGSHRFMTWVARSEDLSVRYAQGFFRSKPGINALGQASPGSAGRNRTLSIKGFEEILVPLPPREDQDRIVAHLDRLAGVEADARRSQGAGSIAVGRYALAILPRALGDALRRPDLPTVPLGELCRNSHRVVRPGEPLLGAESFVGLEHIESHTGRRIASRPIAEETGRKIHFTPGTVTYGYLRPYLNKVWVADRTGLCSVEQYVLTPSDRVDPELLGALLRSDLVLTPAKEATNGLQLPRLGSSALLGFPVPDIRRVPRAGGLITKTRDLTELVSRLAQASDQRNSLIEAVLPAARNKIFTELMAGATS
jgi:type I restriction enzyme, S subunit